jgi:hypothetical protein
MIVGKNGKFNGKGYVCFIDVLGFSNDILKNWHNSESNPLEKILSIKDKMPIFDESAEEDESESHRKYVCRVNTVSDSVTICFGYDENIMVGDMVLGLEAVIGNIAYIWSTFISEGYTIRGAIDFGDIYWDTNELIGPAFINAYRLESEVAKNSRVIISSDLNRELKNLFLNYESVLTEHLIKRFRKDVDGYIIIDPSLLHDTEEQRAQLVDDLESMRSKVNSGIVKEKYTPLISMLSEDAPEVLVKSEFGKY